jgi:hypothetical protein
MTAAYDQANARENVPARRQPAGVNVAFDVIGPNERDSEGDGKHFGCAEAYQQGPDQTRGVVNGNATDVLQANPGFLERLINDGKKSLQMRSGRNLGNNAAEASVQIGLGSDDAGKNGWLVGEDGSSRFIAGGFNAKK